MKIQVVFPLLVQNPFMELIGNGDKSKIQERGRTREFKENL